MGKMKLEFDGSGKIQLVKDQVPNKSSIELIPYFCEELDLSKDCQNKIVELKEKVFKKRGLSQMGMMPRTFVGSLIYISSTMCSERRSQREIAVALESTEVSIRKGTKKLTKFLEL